MIEYITTLVINAAIFALFSLGLNLQWGFAGLVNFGHVAFMTVGAYTTVLLCLNGMPWFLAFLIAAHALIISLDNYLFQITEAGFNCLIGLPEFINYKIV